MRKRPPIRFGKPWVYQDPSICSIAKVFVCRYPKEPTKSCQYQITGRRRLRKALSFVKA